MPRAGVALLLRVRILLRVFRAHACILFRYMQHREQHDDLNDDDKAERRKELLHMRMFGAKTDEHADSQRRKQEALSKNALDRQFRRSDFNPTPGTCVP